MPKLKWPFSGSEERKRAQGTRIHRNKKKNEIHIQTQKLYFILIKPPNRLNWNPKQTPISFNNQITFFFLFYLEAIYSRQFITERDESHARLLLSSLNSFLLSPFQRVDLSQITTLNLLLLSLISDFIRRGMDESLLILALCLFTCAKHWFCWPPSIDKQARILWTWEHWTGLFPKLFIWSQASC